MAKAVVIYVRGLGQNTLKWALKRKFLPYLKSTINEGTIKRVKPFLPLDHWVNELSFLRGDNPGVFSYSGYTGWNWEEMRPENSGIERIERLFFRDIFSNRVYPIGDFKHRIFTIGFEQTFTPNSMGINSVSIPPVRFLNGYGEPVLFTTQEEALEVNDTGKIVPIKVAENRVKTVLEGMMGTKSHLLFEVRENNLIMLRTDRDEVEVRKGEVSRPIEILFKNRLLRRIRGYYQFYIRSITPHLIVSASPLSVQLESQFVKHTRPGGVFAKLERDAGPIILRNPYAILNSFISGWIDRRAMLRLLEWDIMGLTQILMRSTSWNSEDVIVVMFPHLDIAYHCMGGDGILWAVRELDWIIGWLNHIYGIRPFVVGDFSMSRVRKVVDLNRYFLSRGIINLKNIDRVPYSGIHNFWDDVDWDNTIAFSLGGGRVFVNRKNSQFKDGAIKREMEDKIISVVNGLNRIYGGGVKRVVRKYEIYSGELFHEMPDLLVCFGGGLFNGYMDFTDLNNRIFNEKDAVQYEHLSQDNERNDGVMLSPVKTSKDAISIDRVMEDIMSLLE